MERTPEIEPTSMKSYPQTMELLFNLLSAEIFGVLFFLVNFYFREGWFSRFSISVTISLIVLITTLGLSLYATRIFSQSEVKIGGKLYKWIGEKLHQQNLFIALSVILAIVLVGGILFNQDISTTSFGLIPGYYIVIGISIVVIEIMIGLTGLRFKWLGKLLAVAGIVFKRYGVIGLFFLISTLKITLLTPIAHNLIHNDDAYLYSQMARHIKEGLFTIIDFNHYPPFYPFAIHPIFYLDSIQVYSNLVIINVLYLTSAIFPIYLLARIFFDEKISLIFAVATAFYPAQIFYPALFMSENISYPLFFWALYFCISPPNNYKNVIILDVLAGISIGLLWLTRYMTITLVPVFLLIWWIRPDITSNSLNILPTRQKLLRLIILGGAIIGIMLIWIIPGLDQGVEITSLLGFHVEGKSFHRVVAIQDTSFWWGISVVYLVLMTAPVLQHLIGSIELPMKIRSSSPAHIKIYWLYWLVAFSLILIVLIFVVTRHAWLASYNIVSPYRYVARYIIYLSVLLWLTGIVSLRDTVRSAKRIIITGLISVFFVYLSYWYLLQQNWLVTDFLYNGSIDFLNATTYSSLYPVWISLFFIITGIYLNKRQTTKATYITIYFLFLFSIGSWPEFLTNLEGKNVHGRAIHELVTQILDNPEKEYMLQNKEKLVFLIPWRKDEYSEELELRGIHTGEISFKKMDFKEFNVTGCHLELALQYNQTETYLVLYGSDSCKVGTGSVISQYLFFKRDYYLVKTDLELSRFFSPES